MSRFVTWIWNFLTKWLLLEKSPVKNILADYHRFRGELKAGDVVLVEGRSRISDVIKLVTQSTWTHSAIYIGSLNELEDSELKALVQQFYEGDPEEKLLVEALLGSGTIVVPVSKYKRDHLRICRPSGLCPEDARKVVDYSIRRLGTDYDVRQLLDLARFFFPWTILPRRWRSSLFEHNAGNPTRTVCSHLIAEAFMSVNYPILPFIDRREDGSLRFFKRNPRLFTPRDFDYSPYFNIVKYPFLGLDDLGVYRQLPWSTSNLVYNDDEISVLAEVEEEESVFLRESLAEQTGSRPCGEESESGFAVDIKAFRDLMRRLPAQLFMKKREN
jgi:hypothetical protein